MPVITRTLDLKPVATALDGLKAPLARLSAWKVPAPKITSLVPAEHVEQKGFPLEVHGSGFAKGAQVGVTSMSGAYYWDDKPTFHDATHLTAKVADGYGAGEHKVRVWNPGDLYSNEFPFKFTPKAPKITRIEPAKHQEKAAFTLHVYGEGFTKESVVEVTNKDGTLYPRTTKFVDAGHLSAEIDSGYEAGECKVYVRNDVQKARVWSNEVTLKLTAAPKHAPVITSLEPEQQEESQSFTLTVNGRNFNKDATIYIDGHGYSTHYTNSVHIETHIDHDDGAAEAGTKSVQVKEADGDSNTKTFTIKAKPKPPAPAAEITRLYPDSVVEDEHTIIHIMGNHIDPAGALWGDNFDITERITSRQGSIVYFRLPDRWNHESSPVAISWQNPGANRSNSKTVYIRQKEEEHHPVPPVEEKKPPPFIQQIDTHGPLYAHGAITFDVIGDDFVLGAEVYFGGSSVPTTFFDKRKLKAVIEPAPDAEKYNVWVKNPDRQVSRAVTIQIVNLDPTPHIDRIELRGNDPYDKLMGLIQILGSGFDVNGKLWSTARPGLPAEVVGRLGGVATASNATTLYVKVIPGIAWLIAGEIPVYWVNTSGKQSNAKTIPRPG